MNTSARHQEGTGNGHPFAARPTVTGSLGADGYERIPVEASSGPTLQPERLRSSDPSAIERGKTVRRAIAVYTNRPSDLGAIAGGLVTPKGAQVAQSHTRLLVAAGVTGCHVGPSNLRRANGPGPDGRGG